MILLVFPCRGSFPRSKDRLNNQARLWQIAGAERRSSEFGISSTPTALSVFKLRSRPHISADEIEIDESFDKHCFPLMKRGESSRPGMLTRWLVNIPGRDDSPLFIRGKQCLSKLSSISISSAEICGLLRNLKTDKAVGVDEIPNSLLRLSAPAICLWIATMSSTTPSSSPYQSALYQALPSLAEVSKFSSHACSTARTHLERLKTARRKEDSEATNLADFALCCCNA